MGKSIRIYGDEMITETIKTRDGQVITQFFPENEEDEKTLETMKKDGNLEELDGFQADVPLDDVDI